MLPTPVQRYGEDQCCACPSVLRLAVRCPSAGGQRGAVGDERFFTAALWPSLLLASMGVPSLVLPTLMPRECPSLQPLDGPLRSTAYQRGRGRCGAHLCLSVCVESLSHRVEAPQPRAVPPPCRSHCALWPSRREERSTCSAWGHPAAEHRDPEASSADLERLHHLCIKCTLEIFIWTLCI